MKLKKTLKQMRQYSDPYFIISFVSFSWSNIPRFQSFHRVFKTKKMTELVFENFDDAYKVILKTSFAKEILKKYQFDKFYKYNEKIVKKVKPEDYCHFVFINSLDKLKKTGFPKVVLSTIHDWFLSAVIFIEKKEGRVVSSSKQKINSAVKILNETYLKLKISR